MAIRIEDLDAEAPEITIEDIFAADGLIARYKPGYEMRPEQVDVAELAQRAINEKRDAIIEAGTGIGKSFALVVPAVLSGKRTVISTETIVLQSQYIDKDLPFLQSILPKPFRFAVAKGKSNYVCRTKVDEYLGQPLLGMFADPGEVSNLVDWSQETKTGDKAEPDFTFSDASWQTVGADEFCARKQCRYYVDGCKGYTDCFAHKARREFLNADIAVTNHTLLLLNAEIGGDVILGGHEVCIVDEAHTLAEQAQKTLGFEIKQKTFSGFAKYAAKVCKGAGLNLAEYFDATTLEEPERQFFERFRRLAKDQMTFAQIPDLLRREMQTASEPVLRALDLLRSSLNSIMPNSDEDQELLNQLDDRAREHAGALKGLFDPKDNWLPFVELQTPQGGSIDDRRVTLNYKPVDVAGILRHKLYDERQSTILASATLTVEKRFTFPIRELGLEDPLTLQVDSPFDYAAQCQAYYPTHLPLPQHPEYHTQLADEITSLLVHTQGRAFVLFTAYRDLKAVYELVSRRLTFTAMRQGDMPKAGIRKDLEEFIRGHKARGDDGAKTGADQDPYAILRRSVNPIRFNPAQDVIAGTLYYTIYIQTHSKAFMPFVVSSNREVFRLTKEELLTRDFTTEPSAVPFDEGRWSIGDQDAYNVYDFLDGKAHVEPKELYEKVRWYFKRFLRLPDPLYYDFLTLWVMATYHFRLYDAFGYIFFNAIKGSGKTQALTILSWLAHNANLGATVTEAGLKRLVNANSATLLNDEAERLCKKIEDDTSTIFETWNGGYQKSGCAIMVNKETLQVERFCTYSPKAMANTRGLDNVLEDRCITLYFVKDVGQIPQLVQGEQAKKITVLRNMMYCFSLEYIAGISETKGESKRPEKLSGREWELWQPMLVLAQFLDAFQVVEGEDLEYPDSTKIRIDSLHERMAKMSVERKNYKADLEAEANPQSQILRILWQFVQSHRTTDDWYSGLELRQEIKDEMGWDKLPTDRALGRIIFEELHIGTSRNKDKKRDAGSTTHRGHKYYLVPALMLQRGRQMFGVDLSKKEDGEIDEPRDPFDDE